MPCHDYVIIMGMDLSGLVWYCYHVKYTSIFHYFLYFSPYSWCTLSFICWIEYKCILNANIHMYFMSLLNIEMAQIIEIPHLATNLSYVVIWGGWGCEVLAIGLTPFFLRSIPVAFWRAYGWIVFPLLKLLVLLADILLQHRALFEC